MTLAITLSFLTQEGFWVGVGISAAAYAILALGMQLNLGTTGILNFGQAGFMAVGAYTMAALVVHAGLGLWTSALLGTIAASVSALLIGVTALRLRSDYLAIATLAYAEIIFIVIGQWDGVTGGTQGIYGYTSQWQTIADDLAPILGRLGLGDDFLLPLMTVSWALFAVLAIGIRLLTGTPWGRVARAIRDDEDAVRALGKNTLAVKLQSLMLAAALAGIAGYVIALELSILTPETITSAFTVVGFAVILLGGLGSYAGVAVGSIALLFLLSATRYIGLPLSDDRVAAFRYLVVGVVLVAIVAVRPRGILGERTYIANE